MSCKRIRLMCGVLAATGWLTGLGITLKWGQDGLCWLLMTMAFAAAATAVLGIAYLTRGPQGAFELGYRIGLADGRAVARASGQSGQVVPMRRKVDV